MTTIIVDSRVGVMGADRRQVSNDSDIVMQGACKINKIELDDGIHLVACSGHESPAAIFLEWYEWGDDDKPLDALELNEDEDEGFEGVVLTPQADILIADRFMVPYKIPDRFYGSGTDRTDELLGLTKPAHWGVVQNGGLARLINEVLHAPGRWEEPWPQGVHPHVERRPLPRKVLRQIGHTRLRRGVDKRVRQRRPHRD